MKLYVAAPFEQRDAALIVKTRLEEAGHEVNASWLTPQDNQSMNALERLGNKVERCRGLSVRDIDQIYEGDGLVLLKPEELHRQPTTGGHHTETGVALAFGRPVYLVGARENVFHYHELVQVVADVDELLEVLYREKITQGPVRDVGHDTGARR